MIQFSELRLSNDGRKLYIECAVEDFNIYNDVYISKIYVDYYKNRLSSGSPSEHAICVYDNVDDDYTVKSYSATVYESQIEGVSFGTAHFAGGLFYVYVICDVHGTSLASADCGWDNMTTMGIIADWKKVYDEGMVFTADVANNSNHMCGISDGFEDFILRWYALRLSMETCDYDSVDSIWDNMFNNLNAHYSSTGCGCGR